MDEVSLRVQRPSGRQRVQMLVAYGVRRDGTRERLAFLRSQGESQTAWEGLLEDLYRRGLKGEKLQLIIFQRFNLEWKTRTLKLFTQTA